MNVQSYFLMCQPSNQFLKIPNNLKIALSDLNQYWHQTKHFSGTYLNQSVLTFFLSPPTPLFPPLPPLLELSSQPAPIDKLLEHVLIFIQLHSPLIYWSGCKERINTVVITRDGKLESSGGLFLALVLPCCTTLNKPFNHLLPKHRQSLSM